MAAENHRTVLVKAKNAFIAIKETLHNYHQIEELAAKRDARLRRQRMQEKPQLIFKQSSLDRTADTFETEA